MNLGFIACLLIFLLPRGARLRVEEWEVYRTKEYSRVWNRLVRDISIIATDQKLYGVDPKHRISSNINDELKLFTSKNRQFENEINFDWPFVFTFSSLGPARFSTAYENRAFKYRLSADLDEYNSDFDELYMERDLSSNQSSSGCLAEKELLENDLKDQTASTNQSTTLYIQDKATDFDHTTSKLSDSSNNRHVVPLMCYGFRQMFLISFNVVMMLGSVLAIVSSGSNTQFIDRKALRKLNLEPMTDRCQRPKRLLSVFHGDYRVEETIRLPLKFKDWVGVVRFYVVDNCPAEVILGAPFIDKYKSEFNWEQLSFVGARVRRKDRRSPNTPGVILTSLLVVNDA